MFSKSMLLGVSVKFICCLLLIVFLGNSRVFAQTQASEPEKVLRAEVAAESQQQWPQLTQLWVAKEQPNLQAFFADKSNQADRTGYFNMLAARIVALRELPLRTVQPYINVDSYIDQYGSARVFFVAIDYQVQREDRYHYNGVNFRLITLVSEADQWHIAEMSEAPLDALISNGQGFGSADEKAALQIFRARVTKGEIRNSRGELLDTNAAPPVNLHLPIPESVGPNSTELHAITPTGGQPATIVAVTPGAPSQPSTIRVKMSNPGNVSFYGCSGCIWTIDFNAYIRDVLPNEWNESSWVYTSVRAGAMGVKMYGWYRTRVAKYPGQGFDAWDNTNDQYYLANSRKTYSDDNINAIAGTGIWTDSSHYLFQTSYLDGSYNNAGYHGGTMYQWGSKYLGDQGSSWSYILHYYYDMSPTTANQNVNFFYY